MINQVSPLKVYIDQINPDLSNRVKDWTLYDAVCEICAVYGVEPPGEYDIVADTVDDIVNNIKETQL